MKKLFFASLAFFFALIGCNNEEEPSETLTSEEAKTALDESISSVSTDIVSFVESEGVEELTYIFDLINEKSLIGGRISQKQWTKERLDIIVQHFVDGPSGKVGIDNPSDLEDIKGLYVWNPSTNNFDVYKSDFFIVQFPSEGSDTNNAEFKISALEYITIDGGDWVLTSPKVINAELKIDDSNVVELAYNVTWTDNWLPEVAEVSLLVSPFNLTINFKDTFDKSTNLLTSLSLNQELITSIDVDVSYETESKVVPFLIEGNVQYRGLKIEGNANAKDIGLNGDPNNYINVELYSDNAKIGDIVFLLEEDEDGFQDYIPYVSYLDGSKEKLDDILNPVLDEIEILLEEFQ